MRKQLAAIRKLRQWIMLREMGQLPCAFHDLGLKLVVSLAGNKFGLGESICHLVERIRQRIEFTYATTRHTDGGITRGNPAGRLRESIDRPDDTHHHRRREHQEQQQYADAERRQCHAAGRSTRFTGSPLSTSTGNGAGDAVGTTGVASASRRSIAGSASSLIGASSSATRAAFDSSKRFTARARALSVSTSAVRADTSPWARSRACRAQSLPWEELRERASRSSDCSSAASCSAAASTSASSCRLGSAKPKTWVRISSS